MHTCIHAPKKMLKNPTVPCTQWECISPRRAVCIIGPRETTAAPTLTTTDRPPHGTSRHVATYLQASRLQDPGGEPPAIMLSRSEYVVVRHCDTRHMKNNTHSSSTYTCGSEQNHTSEQDHACRRLGRPTVCSRPNLADPSNTSTPRNHEKSCSTLFVVQYC